MTDTRPEPKDLIGSELSRVLREAILRQARDPAASVADIANRVEGNVNLNHALVSAVFARPEIMRALNPEASTAPERLEQMLGTDARAEELDAK